MGNLSYQTTIRVREIASCITEEAQIVQSIQLNAMKPTKFIGHHQVPSTVLGTWQSMVLKTRSCPS